MVAHLVRLKLALLAGGLRRSPWVVVGTVLGALYGLGVLTMAVSALGYVSTLTFELREMVGVILGAALVAVWWFVPLVAFGLDSTLDPARFATFPVPRRQLVVGLALSGLIGVPGVLTVLGAAATAVLWWQEPAAIPAALLGAALAVLTCIVGSRALTTALAPLVVRRKVREAGVALVLVPLVLVGPVMSRLVPEGFDLRQADVAPLVRVLGWTPLGAPWALAPDVAAGRWALAGGHLLVALAGLLGVAWVWERALGRVLVEPVRETTKRRDRGLGWFGRLPARPTGAIAARCLTYWSRDPRYAMAVVLVPVLPVVFALVNPGGPLPLVAGPLSGFLMGWAISADIAYDGTAFWMHASAPLPGRADRWGRALAALALAVPVVVVISVVSALALDRPGAIPALVGGGLGTALTSLGVSSVVSALVVYPVKQPGDNPFAVRQGATMPALLTQVAGWTTVAVLTAPVLVLTALAVARDQPGLGWAALVVGPVLGAVVLVVGVVLGGRALDRTGPDRMRRLLTMAERDRRRLRTREEGEARRPSPVDFGDVALTIGIVGLPNVGKSTLFNALTRASVLAANYPFATIEPNVGVVPLPDPRLTVLADLFASERVVPATVSFVDIAGIVKGASEGEGLGNKFLANIREADAICVVTRAFADPDVVHVTGRVDPADDIETIRTELALADLQTLDKVVPRLEKEVRTKRAEPAALAAAQAAVDALGAGRPLIGEPGLDVAELAPYSLLSAKPVIYVFNTDDAGLADAVLQDELRASVAPADAIFLDAKFESELAELEPDEAREMLVANGQQESGLDQLARVGFHTLGLQTYLTAGPKESRAWTIHAGWTAPQAAGVIHTDFQKGFIKAEVISYDDLVAAGTVAAARAVGKARIEGKDYVMADGDVVEFRFNV